MKSLLVFAMALSMENAPAEAVAAGTLAGRVYACSIEHTARLSLRWHVAVADLPNRAELITLFNQTRNANRGHRPNRDTCPALVEQAKQHWLMSDQFDRPLFN